MDERSASRSIQPDDERRSIRPEDRSDILYQRLINSIYYHSTMIDWLPRELQIELSRYLYHRADDFTIEHRVLLSSQYLRLHPCSTGSRSYVDIPLPTPIYAPLSWERIIDEIAAGRRVCFTSLAICTVTVELAQVKIVNGIAEVQAQFDRKWLELLVSMIVVG